MKVGDEQKATIWMGLLSKAVIDDVIDQKMYLKSEVWTSQWRWLFGLWMKISSSVTPVFSFVY